MTNNSKQLIESIKVLDNKIYNLSYHQARMQASTQAIFGKKIHFDLNTILNELRTIPGGLFKLRIVYDAVSFQHAFIPYTRKQKESLKLVFDDVISYQYKSENRTSLTELFEKRGHHDDIVIVKNGLLTDSYYCNVALCKAGEWYTPRQPLLIGTKRAQLLADDLIKEADIAFDELHLYSKLRLFNALIAFGEVELSIQQIF